MSINMSVSEKAYDVIVAGGGPAGFGAALAAARSGASTLLIERYGYLGGMASTGLPFLTYRDGTGKQRIFGIPGEFARRARESGFTEDTPVSNSWLVIDPEGVKLLFQEMLMEAGVDIMLHSWVGGAFTQADNLEALLVLSKGGNRAVKGKAFVDCTGDGDIAALCGVPFVLGREDGKMMGLSLLFALTRVDTDRFQEAVRGRWSDLVKEKGIKIPPEIANKTFLSENKFMPFMINPRRPGEVIFNWVQQVLDKNPLEPNDLSEAEIESRRLIHLLANEVLRPHVPGCEEAYIAWTAGQMGVRETRRIRGLYTLTETDCRDEVDFPDTIALCTYHFDLHASSREDSESVYLDREFKGAIRIPYRVMIPAEGPSNLLVAGRSVSADRMALSAIRVMVPCMSMGEAAGYAAALCSSNDTAARDVDIEEVKRNLELDL
jgi:hypothetical protein